MLFSRHTGKLRGLQVTTTWQPELWSCQPASTVKVVAVGLQDGVLDSQATRSSAATVDQERHVGLRAARQRQPKRLVQSLTNYSSNISTSFSLPRFTKTYQ